MAEDPCYSNQLILSPTTPTGFIRPLSLSFAGLVNLLRIISSIFYAYFKLVNYHFSINWTSKIMFAGVRHFNCWTRQTCANPSRLN